MCLFCFSGLVRLFLEFFFVSINGIGILIRAHFTCFGYRAMSPPFLLVAIYSFRVQLRYHLLHGLHGVSKQSKWLVRIVWGHTSFTQQIHQFGYNLCTQTTASYDYRQSNIMK